MPVHPPPPRKKEIKEIKKSVTSPLLQKCFLIFFQNAQLLLCWFRAKPTMTIPQSNSSDSLPKLNSSYVQRNLIPMIVACSEPNYIFTLLHVWVECLDSCQLDDAEIDDIDIRLVKCVVTCEMFWCVLCGVCVGPPEFGPPAALIDPMWHGPISANSLPGPETTISLL